MNGKLKIGLLIELINFIFVAGLFGNLLTFDLVVSISAILSITTTAIYGMIIALLLLFVDTSSLPLYPGWGALLGAGLAAGFGAIGPGIGEGMAAGATVKEMSRNPEATDVLTRTMLVGMAVTESTGVYALVVALLLIAV